MAILIIDDVRINTSLNSFHLEGVSASDIESVLDKIAKFEETKNLSLIPQFMSLVDEGDTLYPLSFAFGFSKGKPASYAAFSKHHNFFGEDRKLITEFHGLTAENTTGPYIRRVLLALHLTTDVKSLTSLTENIWSTWISNLKTLDTQWCKELNFNAQHKRAFSMIGEYLSATNPSGTLGYLQPLKIARKSTPGSLTAKTKALLNNPSEDMKRWVQFLREYQEVRTTKSSRVPNNSFRIFATWLEKFPQEIYSDPRVFLSAPRTTPSWTKYIKSLSTSRMKSSHIDAANYICDFTNWLIDDQLIVTEDGERVSLAHPLMTSHERKMFDQETKVFSPPKTLQSTSIPMPLKYVQKIQQILKEDDWAWPKSLESQCLTHWVNGRAETFWNPVVTYLIYALTELPWRKIQFKTLDSGEGDSVYFDLEGNSWVVNKSVAAGHWDREVAARRKRRGIINFEEASGQVGFYVNTNKTADRIHNYGESAGYFVPWKNDVMIRLFSDLRAWQEKFNPLSKPSSYEEVWPAFSGANRPSEAVIRMTPDRFYLFRDIQGRTNKCSPPSDNRILTVWRLLMGELEVRLREEGDETQIVIARNQAGSPSTSHFNIHGLRVSGLSAFAEAGVPIEILSKLVAGHASVLMTIYYLKYTPSHVTDVLSNARQKFEAISAGDFGRHLRDVGFKEAARVAVAAEDYTLKRVSEGEISTDLFFDVGIGICPFAGTRCSDGVDNGGGRKSAVPGGAKNCIDCRHFITGEPWLTPLVLNQQRLAATAQSLSQKWNSQTEQLNSLETRRAKHIRKDGLSSIPAELKRLIAHLEQEIDRDGHSLDDLLLSMHRQHNFIEKIKSLQAIPNEDRVPVLIADERFEVEGYREGTRFELIDSVLQGSRIYPILYDDGLEIERMKFIDAIMYHNDMTPLSMMSLSEIQKKRAADASAEWLMRKIGAQETDLLIKGAQTLEEMGFDSLELSNQISNAAEGIRLVGRADDNCH